MRNSFNSFVEARKAASVTQFELAACLRRHQSFISKYERGERRLDVIEFWQVAETLGQDQSKLLKDFVDSERR
jgi:transcriptional regulator with XRE-family HTH domain